MVGGRPTHLLTVIAPLLIAFSLRAAELPAPPQGEATVAQAIADLGDKDLTRRWQATYRLGLAGASAAGAVPALVQTLADVENQEYVRGGAAWALGCIGSPQAVGPLSSALDSALESVRRHAAEALGKIGPSARAAVPKLLERLNDPDPVVRVHAAVSLWRLGRQEQALPALTALLEWRTPEVRFETAMALGELGPEAAPAGPPLVRVLQRDDADAARAAAWALGRVGMPAAPALEKLFPQSPAPCRCRVLEAFQEMGPPAVTLLAPHLADRDPAVRRTAARALGQLGPAARTATAGLMAAVNDPVAEVRGEAAQALRRIGEIAPLRNSQGEAP